MNHINEGLVIDRFPEECLHTHLPGSFSALCFIQSGEHNNGNSIMYPENWTEQ